MKFEYHEICKWLPYKEEVVAEIAEDMKEHGYREDRPISLFHGKILDGRHRYEAALRAGVEPFFQDYLGTTQGAIDYVTSENVKRRMLTNREKEFFYAQRADALGVRKREDTLKQNSTDVSNDTTAPSQDEHADEIGVSRPTVARWEKDRKEIKADPELAKKADTFEGYVEAKKEVQNRRKEAIRNTEEPKVIDLGAIARNKEHTDIRKIGPAFIANMEILCTKFDRKDIERELVAFMEPDPLGLKVKALHMMAEILTDLCDDYPEIKSTNVN